MGYNNEELEENCLNGNQWSFKNDGKDNTIKLPKECLRVAKMYDKEAFTAVGNIETLGWYVMVLDSVGEVLVWSEKQGYVNKKHDPKNKTA